MIEFELDIPSLTEDGIQLRGLFTDIKELSCTSVIDKWTEQ